MKVRIENNRSDKVLLKKCLQELESAVVQAQGLNDLDRYRQGFEAQFASYVGAAHARAVNSGTDALHLALLALGVGAGHEVLVPDVTYVSTALAVRFAGATPVYVDVRGADLTLDTRLLERALTPRTKAVMAVHMFGNPCAMTELSKFAKAHRLLVVEDCCQALGSRLGPKSVGSFSDAAAFSFSYYKPLSSLSGNGGMVVCRQARTAERIDALLNFWKLDPLIAGAGRKFHKIALPDLATVKVKFSILEAIIASREKSSRRYEKGLRGLRAVSVPSRSREAVTVKENFLVFCAQRDRLRNALARQGIDTDLPYEPVHRAACCADPLASDRSFPEAMRYFREGLHLPLYSFMRDDECDSVIRSVVSFAQGIR